MNEQAKKKLDWETPVMVDLNHMPVQTLGGTSAHSHEYTYTCGGSSTAFFPGTSGAGYESLRCQQ